MQALRNAIVSAMSSSIKALEERAERFWIRTGDAGDVVIFQLYLIYMIVSEAFEKGEKVPTFVIANRDDKDYFLRVDSNNGNGVVHKPTLELTPNYLITDTRGRSSCLFTRQYLHVSGINNTNVKYVRKMIEQRPPKNKKPRRFISFPGFPWQEYFEADSNGETNPVR